MNNIEKKNGQIILEAYTKYTFDRTQEVIENQTRPQRNPQLIIFEKGNRIYKLLKFVV